MDKVLSNLDSNEFKEHFNKWNFFDFEGTLEQVYNHKPYTSDIILKKPGQLFLYEKVTPNECHYPKLATFLHYIPCDQTLELEFVDVIRTIDEKKDPYVKSEIKREIQWNSYLMIYDVWDSYPNWKQIRRAYERTWWFHKTKQEKRDIKINQILNG